MEKSALGLMSDEIGKHEAKCQQDRSRVRAGAVACLVTCDH